MAVFPWHSRSRNYKAEFASCRLEAVPLEFGDYHPLKPITVTESKTKKVSRKGSTSSTSSSSSSSVVDPLSSVLDGTDPLSMFAATAEPAATDSSRKRRDRDENSIVGSDFEPWASKRGEILARYTTTEKLSINLFMGSEKGKAGTATSAMSEKVRTRLEELDDFEEGSQKELLNLTQQDYVNRIEELNQSLKDAWASDQKVKALKIVIQDQPVNFCLLPAPLPLKNWDFDRDCVGFTKLVRFAILTVCSKLLSDTSVIQFYPSKFVLITDILDTFGKLVYERIFSMCVDNRSVLPDHFSPENVNDTAKETCLNWFFKIASIRELIPRFYVEASILKCNKFLSKMGISECLPRLTCMIRGIGDPLVSVYARAYLCRVGMEVAPHLKESLNKNFFDFLLTFKQIHGDTVQNQLVVQGVELPSYLPLYSPAMDWIFQCISYHAPEALLTEMMERCKKLGNNALLLNSVMSAFRAEFIATRSMDFIGMIKECDESGFPKHLLFRSLGLNLALADPPEGDRLQILNEAWKVITKLKNPQDYINCAEVWVEYTCKHFTKREVNTVLADVIKHMTPDRAFEDSYPQLQSIIKKVIAHFHDFSVLFSVEKFLPFLDMFQKESVRVEVCKCIMEVFIKHQQEPTKDPVILNALLHVCKTMHDSVNALTLEDEKRMLAYLINGFIKMVSFGRDFEQQLSFYVEARSMFCNLEPVLVQLIHSVNRLAMETRKVMKGNHSRKTAAFVRACVAYCFITIPSLVSIFTRLNLYLHSGQVALANQCLSQADAFFKAAISLIPEVPKMINIDGKMRPSESFLLEFLCNFFSTLLIVPDHPEHGVLFLVRELLNVIQDYTWEDNGDDKIRIYTCVLHLLSAMSQETYLYHIDKVDSNDSLYGGDSKFLAENNKLCETVMAQILEHLKTLAKDEALKRQSSLGLSFFNSILAHGDLRNNRLNQLSVNLWHLAQRHGCADTRTMVKTLEYIKRRSKQPDMGHLTELALRLPLQTRT
ncbi:VPS35 endosomal protein-sorting factor-like isoform X4 [Canis lupus baileyi]|uniref:VPS35 endosomal protein-sorting factor-like isoform X4 n=1 Tax=Canis lupus dingo TaxID=286419 RepID=UPI0015F15A76|nr:VPS35 endosomal protein-sorting factor-like isoform X4 [Canis lupus dingo]XP_038396143.1 VPS35 endosomal protein-sorting factor-like isoform X5 [Canis lupus familiaris]